MSNFMWDTCVEVFDEDGDLLEIVEVDFRMSRPEIAGYIESIFEPADDENLSYRVGQQFAYVCPLTGYAEETYENDIIPWSAVYAQLEEGEFVWSDEEGAWIYAPGDSDFS